MEKDKNTILWIIGVVLIIMLAFGSFFGIGGYGMMGFGMGFGWIFMIVFWGALIWIVVALVNQSQSNTRKDEDALEILRKRYAKGEITKKQYEEMRKELLR
jgi:putative membrane protein